MNTPRTNPTKKERPTSFLDVPEIVATSPNGTKTPITPLSDDAVFMSSCTLSEMPNRKTPINSRAARPPSRLFNSPTKNLMDVKQVQPTKYETTPETHNEFKDASIEISTVKNSKASKAAETGFHLNHTGSTIDYSPSFEELHLNVPSLGKASFDPWDSTKGLSEKEDEEMNLFDNPSNLCTKACSEGISLPTPPPTRFPSIISLVSPAPSFLTFFATSSFSLTSASTEPWDCECQQLKTHVQETSLWDDMMADEKKAAEMVRAVYGEVLEREGLVKDREFVEWYIKREDLGFGKDA